MFIIKIEFLCSEKLRISSPLLSSKVTHYYHFTVHKVFKITYIQPKYLHQVKFTNQKY